MRALNIFQLLSLAIFLHHGEATDAVDQEGKEMTEGQRKLQFDWRYWDQYNYLAHTGEPTPQPTFKPTPYPTPRPTPLPTTAPPTEMPTARPTETPSEYPTQTEEPSEEPTLTSEPSENPTTTTSFSGSSTLSFDGGCVGTETIRKFDELFARSMRFTCFV